MPRYIMKRTFSGEGLRIPVTEDGAATCLGVVDRNANVGVTWAHSYVPDVPDDRFFHFLTGMLGPTYHPRKYWS